jgi:hypothetical protein
MARNAHTRFVGSVPYEFATRWVFWAAIDLAAVVLVAALFHGQTQTSPWTVPVMGTALAAGTVAVVVSERLGTGMARSGLRYWPWIGVVLAWSAIATPRLWVVWTCLAVPQGSTLC